MLSVGAALTLFSYPGLTSALILGLTPALFPGEASRGVYPPLPSNPGATSTLTSSIIGRLELYPSL
jgi:hypothetical protein